LSMNASLNTAGGIIAQGTPDPHPALRTTSSGHRPCAIVLYHTKRKAAPAERRVDDRI
jgi:hypothetical protein